MKLVTRSFAAASTPWAVAYFVTMKPWTPRNGTDGFAIAGTWTTLNGILLLSRSCEFHGPVTQKATFLLRKSCCAVDESTAELIRPSLFHVLIIPACLRKNLFATPMFDGSRLPALFRPKM